MNRIIRVAALLVLLVAILVARVDQLQTDPDVTPPGTYTAFIGVNLVPMTGEIIREEQNVLILGDRIVAVGPERRVEIPDNATIIDGEGAYLMPGLADMHMHTRQDWESERWPVSPLLLFLANGVTTVRDFGPEGGDLTYALRWREQIKSGSRAGPTIYTSGPILFASPLTDPGRMVRENHESGFDFLKVYSYLSPRDFHTALATATELGMYTAGHVPYAVGVEAALAEGMDEIAHVEELLPELIDFDRERQLVPEEWVPYLAGIAPQQFDVENGFDEAAFGDRYGGSMAQIVQELQSAGAAVCTTMIIDDVIQLKLFEPQAFLYRPEYRYSPAGYLERFRQGEEKHQLQCAGIEALCAFKYDVDRWILAQLHEAGVPLLLGTDSGTGGMGIVPGFSIHDEFRILVENGFTPYSAIAAGTVNAAAIVERMVGEGNFGTIEVGKRADLLLVNGNPLADVGAIKNLRGVMAAGHWYSREVLDQLITVKPARDGETGASAGPLNSLSLRSRNTPRTRPISIPTAAKNGTQRGSGKRSVTRTNTKPTAAPAISPKIIPRAR